ncbi:CIA30 family protein [Spirulina sp. 06S082]|uniref:CIA30 family protein n=1 Tax=Spirulina sp. 06S082 TaxID=3110248 RepID=UPI002B1FBD07|nr:CIA30 family protein [Spirulina sp. 06S082]MEA5468460.1 CIA30 family protein [Spirulina sp. 06S082]
MMNKKEHWDFRRFIQTVAYFEGIPFLKCLTRLRNKLSNMDSTPVSPSMRDRVAAILVVAGKESLAKPIIDRLLTENYPVRVWVADISRGTLFDGDEKITLSDRLTPELLTGVEAIICCFGEGQGDRLWEEKLQNLIALATVGEGAKGIKTLFDFNQPDEDLLASWGAVDDVVMGGVSESNIRLCDGFAVFAGTVSTANSGGFASVRHRNFQPPLDLSNYEGIQLQVKGDGKRYKFIARCEGKWDGVSYCYSFDTVANEWISPRIPFQELIPVFRAKTLTDASSFEPRRTYSLQLMFSKFEYDRALNPTFTPGAFSLQVKSIAVYGGKTSPQFILLGSEGEAIARASRFPVTSVSPSQFAADEKAIAQHCLALLNSAS